jgi:hypothetical protein
VQRIVRIAGSGEEPVSVAGDSAGGPDASLRGGRAPGNDIARILQADTDDPAVIIAAIPRAPRWFWSGALKLSPRAASAAPTSTGQPGNGAPSFRDKAKIRCRGPAAPRTTASR